MPIAFNRWSQTCFLLLFNTQTKTSVAVDIYRQNTEVVLEKLKIDLSCQEYIVYFLKEFTSIQLKVKVETCAEAVSI